jgi:AhpD family alkylhydroperoxidase
MATDSGKLVKELQAHMGFVLPFEATLAEEDPEFLAVFSQMKKILMEREGALPRKTKALIHIALSAARRATGIKSHISRAMRLGATKQEILEAMELSTFTFGAPAIKYGVESLIAVLQEQKQAE